jgi:hypothetical protein
LLQQSIFSLQFQGFFLRNGLQDTGCGRILDISGLPRISQRIDGFLNVEIRRTATGNHDSAGISTQGILQQQARQLTVTKGGFRLNLGLCSAEADTT